MRSRVLIITAIILIIVVIIITVCACKKKPEAMIKRPNFNKLIAHWQNENIGAIRIGHPNDNIRLVPPLIDHMEQSALWKRAYAELFSKGVEVLSYGAGSAFSETLLMGALINLGVKVKHWYMVDPWIYENKKLWVRLSHAIEEHTGIKPHYYGSWIELQKDRAKYHMDMTTYPLMTMTIHGRLDNMGRAEDKARDDIMAEVERTGARIRLSIIKQGHVILRLNYGTEMQNFTSERVEPMRT